MPSSDTFGSATTAPVPRPAIFSIRALADSVNQWCEENGVRPVNGQSAPQLNDRNIRYYRLRGLLDAPGSGAPEGAARRGFTEKHAAQLRVIRLLQARGLPLDRIQVSIAGLSLDELRAFQRREMGKPTPASAGSIIGDVFASAPKDGRSHTTAETARPVAQRRAADTGSRGVPTDHVPHATGNGAGESSPSEPALGQEQWLVSAVGEEFLLVSRRGRQITDEQRRLIAAVLEGLRKG